MQQPSPATMNHKRPCVLVVEDDADARWLVVEALVEHGLDVVECRDGADALTQIGARRVDIVILDLGLPGVGGLDVLKAVRSQGNLPVILLTGRGGQSDRVVGLELGADDYVVKPFDPRELVARINAVLRRGRPQETTDILDYGELVIDFRSRDVTRAGDQVDLTAKEFDLLAFLARSPRQVFTREQILDNVWGSSPEWQGSATVNEHIHRLRKKIESDPAKPKWVGTKRGAGYHFTP